MNSGLSSRNKIKIGSGFRFTQKGDHFRTMDKSTIIINGVKLYVDDLDVFVGKNPYIKIYGSIEFADK